MLNNRIDALITLDSKIRARRWQTMHGSSNIYCIILECEQTLCVFKSESCTANSDNENEEEIDLEGFTTISGLAMSHIPG
jgi:hypothetical protein